jgi:hypothetical protein
LEPVKMAALVAPPPRVEGPEQGVIEDARRRQRQRRGVTAVIAIAATLIVLLAYLNSSATTPRPGPAAEPRAGAITPPASVLARDPYMGVSCRIPNSIVCDRVGLTVWLRQPAIAVSATIAGEPLKLNDPMWSGPAHHGRRTTFAGFLQPAGIVTRLHVIPDPGGKTWMADIAVIAKPPPPPAVVIRIDYGHRTVLTEVKVELHSGWG